MVEVDAVLTAVSTRQVTIGHGIPEVCRRHGRPATHRRNFDVESSPARWSYALLPLGLLPFAIARAATRKAIRAARWPFCDGCRRDRRLVAGAAFAVIVGGMLTFASGLTADDQEMGWPRFIIGLLVMMAGYVGLHWTRLAVIAGLRLAQDGQWVEIRNPSAEFAAQLRAHGDPTRTAPRPVGPPPMEQWPHLKR